MTTRVLVVDDHQVVREGVRIVLEADTAMKIVGEAGDGAEALRLARALRPDVVLMDLVMPAADGLTAIAAIRAELPQTEVVVLTSADDTASATGAIRAGAIGYLVKDSGAEDLRQAVCAAAARQVQLTPAVAALLMREVRSEDIASSLTGRETDVLRLIGAGCSNREIARTLGINEKTVTVHVSHLLAKLGLQSRTQAALHALRVGLVATDTMGSRP
jgi:DNA-binding NarL/FixJ family response regulator